MRSASTKQSQGAPWTLVASAKRAKPRLVLVSSVEGKVRRPRPKRSAQPADLAQLGTRLEHAFVKAVKAAKREASRKA